MKKLLLALLIMPMFSFGQISLRPYIGAGYGIAAQEVFLTQRKITGIFIQNAGLSAVYWLNNWLVSAGAGYLTTGYAYDMGTLTYYHNQQPEYLTNANVSYKYQHVIIPVSLGRKFSVGKFALMPEAGIAVAYNLSEKTRFRSDQFLKTKYLNNDQFSSDFNRTSIFADISLTASYKLTDRLSVFCGPSYKLMLTNIINTKSGPFSVANVSQNHRATMLNAGVYIDLSKAKAEEATN